MHFLGYVDELSKYRDENSWSARLLKFFKIKPKTLREYKKATDASNEKLSKLNKLMTKTFKK